MKRLKIKSIIFAHLLAFQGLCLNANDVFSFRGKQQNKKSHEEEIPHKANELYNQGIISLTPLNGTGLFQDILEAQVIVNPNNTISLILKNKNNNVLQYDFLDGQRIEDSRKVVTYSAKLVLLKEEEGGIPTTEANLEIILTDYQFIKEAKSLDNLLLVNLTYDGSLDPSTPIFYHASFQGLPNKKTHHSLGQH